MKNKLSHILRPGLAIYLLILALSAAAALFFREYYLAMVDAGCTLALLVFALVNSRSRRRQLISYIQSTTNALDAALRSESPMPKVVLQLETGEILWASSRFAQMMGQKEALLNAPIAKVLPELDLSFLQEQAATPELSLNGRRYHIFGNIVTPPAEIESGPLANLYFVDMTEYLSVKEEYVGSRPVVAIILVDNYDELTNNLTDNDVSNLNVAINNAVNHWTEGLGGLLRKIERNRYLLVFETHYLQGLVDGKFRLLEDVRKVVSSSGVAATVSLGIGKDGASYGEAYNFAALSIEMALSRGGDQAVVKDRYNFSFYGGRGKEGNNRTKVKARVMAGSLSELISQSSHIFVMGHQNADLDSLGAAAGIQAICRKRGKKANIIVDYQQNSVQEMLDRLSERPEYRDCFLSGESALIMADAKSLLIVVDTNRPDQVQYRPLLGSMSRVAVIDHHRRAADYIDQVVLNLHEPFASSASELVAELLQYAVDPKDVLPEEAMALLAGIVLDTKHFSVRTSGRTFESAAFLRRLGADTVEVKKLLQSDFPSTVARYQIVQKARIYRSEIAIAVLDQTVSRIIAAQAADELVNISNITSSYVLFPQGDRIIISARSIGDANAQVILEALGGGGNPATAGAQIQGKKMAEVVDQLILSINRYYDQFSEEPETN